MHAIDLLVHVCYLNHVLYHDTNNPTVHVHDPLKSRLMSYHCHLFSMHYTTLLISHTRRMLALIRSVGTRLTAEGGESCP